VTWIVASLLGCAVAAGVATAGYHPSCCPDVICKRNDAGILFCTRPEPPLKTSKEPFVEYPAFHLDGDEMAPFALQEV
jgi:hypothetical protein